MFLFSFVSGGVETYNILLSSTMANNDDVLDIRTVPIVKYHIPIRVVIKRSLLSHFARTTVVVEAEHHNSQIHVWDTYVAPRDEQWGVVYLYDFGENWVRYNCNVCNRYGKSSKQRRRKCIRKRWLYPKCNCMSWPIQYVVSYKDFLNTVSCSGDSYVT